VAATNLVLEGRAPESLEGLVRRVDRGLYIGRIWYTYPINGLRAGDFTCTVVADSYVIRDGRWVAPIRPNTLRINDNIATVLDNGSGRRGTGRARACGRPTRSSTRQRSPCRQFTSTRSRASWKICPDGDRGALG
jgi:predicted Zn-dependent protease